MIDILRKERWSPYVVGSLIGLLLTALFLYGQQIGVSTGVSRVAALMEDAAVPTHVAETPYFTKLLADHVLLNWKVLFLIGLFAGAIVAAKVSRGEKGCSSQKIWERAFGTSKGVRYFAAFVGGVLLLLGARFADGCTSGHAISGGAQLSLTSWVFMMSVFAVGIPVSFALYRKR